MVEPSEGLFFPSGGQFSASGRVFFPSGGQKFLLEACFSHRKPCFFRLEGSFSRLEAKYFFGRPFPAVWMGNFPVGRPKISSADGHDIPKSEERS